MKGGPWLLAAGLMGASGVVAGAWAAHGLADQPTARDWATTAANYQMLHALALLFSTMADGRPVVMGAVDGMTRARIAAGALTAARWLFVVGVASFCGTLHALALGMSAPFPGSAPIGGMALIGGWLAIGVAGAAALGGSSGGTAGRSGG